jgi:hypothetical protein
MASEDSLVQLAREPFLLIACTHRIVTGMPNYHYITSPVAWDAQAFQHIAEFDNGPSGGSGPVLPFVCCDPTIWATGLVTRSACRHAVRTVSSPRILESGVQSLRVPGSSPGLPC